MKIKTLMEFLNKDADGPRGENNSVIGEFDSPLVRDEKVVYIENARLETVNDFTQRKELICSGTQWADHRMGEILVDLGKIEQGDINRIINFQRDRGVYFGEAAVEMKLADKEDVLQSLSMQFGYTYTRDESSLSKELAMAYSPFDEQAEEFRAIRGQLLNNWLAPNKKTLAVVSPQSGEGRSYVAANLAMAFSQLGRSTLLIDADLRSPRQHEIFNFDRRIGLSMLLAGRVKLEDLDVLPDQISTFQFLSVLGCGAVPPNPSELLSKNTFALILKELRKYYDVIIIDTPPAEYQSEIISIAAVADSALLVARSGVTSLEKTNALTSLLKQADAEIIGAVLNQF